MQLVPECRKEGIDVTVQDVFQEKTIASLSLYIKVANSNPEEFKLEPTANNNQDSIRDFKEKSRAPNPFSLVEKQFLKTIVQAAVEQCNTPLNEIEDIYPTTALQEALMASTIKRKGMYTSDFTFQLHKNIDIEKFKVAWEATVIANPILRTRIIYTDSFGSFQVVTRCCNINWATSKTLDGYLAINAQSVVGPGKALARFGLIVYDVESQPPGFVLTLHHSIYGTSTPEKEMKKKETLLSASRARLF